MNRLGVSGPRPGSLYMRGYTNQEIVRRGLLSPDEAFIQKPFAPSELNAALARLRLRAGLPE